MSQRFKTMLRGKPVEVEMTIVSMTPVPRFEVQFHSGEPDTPLTRAELAALAREASRVARLKDA